MNSLVDILIKNGFIIDGTGQNGYFGDLAIDNGKISEIGTHLECEAKETIDASGLVVCPGFIDVHSHNDLVPFMDEAKQNLKLLQGVTTELVGQCGLGVVPCMEEDNKLWKNYIRGVVGEPHCQFKKLDDYFTSINKVRLKNNIATLISHGAVHSYVMGFENRKPDEDELMQMCQIVEDAMKAGAFGMSLGLQYMPAIFSSKEELIEICKVVQKYDGIVMVHLRNHDDTIDLALEEMFEIARVSGVKVHISHMRSYASDQVGCEANKLLEMVNQATHEGLRVTFDEHLYLSGSTLLTQVLPPWFNVNQHNEEEINKVKEELKHNVHYKGWDNYSRINGWDAILITSVKTEKNQQYIGKTIGELAKQNEIDPVDLVIQLLIEEDKGVGIVTLDIFSLEDTIQLIKHPLQMVGSDSIPAGNPHPRLYGNYPLFIGKFVRELKALDLETAIHKCTTLPAKTLGMNDRGSITCGKVADLTIFNYDEINGYENYLHSTKAPIGINYVIVNGKIAVYKGKPCKDQMGLLIKFREV